MRAGGVAVLVALGVAAIAGGWYFGTATMPVEQKTMAESGLMFPGLAPRLAAAAKLEITNKGNQIIIEKRPDGLWGVAAMRGYPVQEAKLRGLLTGLTELRLVERRTSDPAEFARLGVDDPNKAESTANLLRVLDQSDKPILAVIVGHRRIRSQGGVPEETYVRRPDENQSWLAGGSLQVDADPQLWLNRDVIDIGHDRIASVIVGDSTLVFGREDGRFRLLQPADQPKLEDYKLEDVSRGLEALTFQTVRADADAPGTETGQTEFITLDGLAVKVRVFHADKEVWARFIASGSAAAKAEADRLNVRFSGWSYQIGAWKEKALVPLLDDLKAKEPEAAAPK